MKLSKEEAICLVLELSDRNIVTSPTKLNKLLARLNLNFIPVDVDFKLNKFGSYNVELSSLEENKYFSIERYTLSNGIQSRKFILKEDGKKLFFSDIKPKLDKILKKEDFDKLYEEINSLSKLKAEEISDNEHKKLLVDVEDRFRLEQKINAIYCDLIDLFQEAKSLSEETLANVDLKALVEYCFYLIKFIKEIRLKHIPESYDFEGYMFDYYFISNIGEIIPFLKSQINFGAKDRVTINKYYQYFVNSVSEHQYPFSLDNPNLHKLVAS